jgi:hypothetical protein
MALAHVKRVRKAQSSPRPVRAQRLAAASRSCRGGETSRPMGLAGSSGSRGALPTSSNAAGRPARSTIRPPSRYSPWQSSRTLLQRHLCRIPNSGALPHEGWAFLQAIPSEISNVAMSQKQAFETFALPLETTGLEQVKWRCRSCLQPTKRQASHITT